jgi:hypothetical protein
VKSREGRTYHEIHYTFGDLLPNFQNRIAAHADKFNNMKRVILNNLVELPHTRVLQLRLLMSLYLCTPFASVEIGPLQRTRTFQELNLLMSEYLIYLWLHKEN